MSAPFELNEELRETLIAAAQSASMNSYAPFSKFAVGAAILTRSQRIFTGCNVENSSFGLTNCAERTAIFTAVAEGALAANEPLLAVACFNRDGVPCAPCGACRQVLYEFGGNEAIVLYRRSDGEIIEQRLKELLPEGFRLSGE